MTLVPVRCMARQHARDLPMRHLSQNNNCWHFNHSNGSCVSGHKLSTGHLYTNSPISSFALPSERKCRLLGPEIVSMQDEA